MQRLLMVILVLIGIPKAHSQVMISGIVTESDSTTSLPFVLVINKSSGQGVMGSETGHFTITSKENDTLLFSYIGFARKYVAVASLAGRDPSTVKVTMSELPYRLKTLNVTAFKLRDYEKDYMKGVIEKSRYRNIDYVEHPFTALYMRYSKEGRQIRKLAEIFEKIMIEEQVAEKFNPSILTKLTGDDQIDFEAFRKYCYYLSDQYIIGHDGIELYSKVMECYRNYKADLRMQR